MGHEWLNALPLFCWARTQVPGEFGAGAGLAPPVRRSPPPAASAHCPRCCTKPRAMHQPENLLTLLLLLLTPLVATAQRGAPELTTVGQEVVVTDSKFARLKADSPERVTVIDSATVARATDLAQLLNDQAGLTVNGAYSNYGTNKSIYLRNAANAATVILIDGQPVLDPSAIGRAADLRLLSLDGVQRIEILRGPGALLYGSDAVAGVINLITRQDGAPQPRPVVDLRAAVQTHDTYDVGATLSQRTAKLDYTLSYDRFRTAGISEARRASDTLPAFDRDGVVRQTLNAGLTYRPAAGLTVRPSLRVARFAGDYDGGSFADAPNTYDNTLLLPSLAVDYAKDKFATGGRYSYARTERTFNATFGVSEFAGTNQQADLFGTYRPTPATYVTGGVQLRDETLDDFADTDNPDATTYSPYLNGGARLGRWLLAEAGVRYDNHSQFGGQATHSVALAADLTRALTLRARSASAFRSPTLDELFGPFGPNPDLQPQTTHSVELGADLVSAPESAVAYALGVTAFRRRTADVIVFDFSDGYQNRDELLDRGVELTATVRPSARLAFNGNFSWVAGELSVLDGNGNLVGTGESFPRRPGTSGTIGATYTAKSPLTVGLSVNYVGERDDVLFNPDFTVSSVILDPYTVVNAYVEYRWLENENLRTFIDVRNALDTDFTEIVGFNTLGRTIRLGVGYRL